MRLASALALLALAACDTTGLEPSPCAVAPLTQNSVVACVVGDVEARVSGRPVPGGWGDYLQPVDLWSLTSGGSASTGGVDLYLYLENGTDAEPGTYPVEAGPTPREFVDLVPVDADARPGLAIARVYLPVSTGGVEVWQAVSGTLTIESGVYPRRAGSFAVTCVHEDGRRIRVEGRFLHVS